MHTMMLILSIAITFTHSFHISWPAEQQGDRYIVQRSTDWDFAQFDTLSIGTANESTDYIVPAGERRFYRVITQRGSLFSEPSATVSGMCLDFAGDAKQVDTLLLYAGSAAPDIITYEKNAGNLLTFLVVRVPFGYTVAWALDMPVIGAPRHETVWLREPVERAVFKR